MKIRPVGTELFHFVGQKHRRKNGRMDELAGRQTDKHDMTKLVVAFRDFAKTRNNNNNNNNNTRQ
jgi:hypothetical protein